MAGILNAPGSGSRSERLLLAGLGLLWLVVALPLLVGERTLILRDVFTTHLPWKAFGAAALAHGSIPAFNPPWALGQPFAGNPNALPFYPGNLLYLVLPFWSAFNAHYVLHWLLAFVGFRKLSRELGQSSSAATLAGLTYGGSGYLLSCLSFYNLIAVAGWLPWVLWGLARGGRRGLAWGGLACGMMLLSGEPVTAALAIVPMLLLASERHGGWRGLVATFAVGSTGLLVALPQVVAAIRVFDFTFRGAHGLVPAQAANHALQWPRLLELLLPLPWGWPAELGRFGYWSDVTPLTPYIFTLHFGLVGLVCALVAFRARKRWALLFVASLALAVAGGLSGEWVLRLTAGLFRYPQKLLLWTTVGAALLAGYGADRLLEAERGRRVAIWLRAAAAGALSVALALVLFKEAVRSFFLGALGARFEWVAATQQTLWFLGFAISAALLAGCAWAVRRGSGAALAGLAALALLQLSPTLATDRVDALAPPAPWIEKLGEEKSVALVANAYPLWAERVAMRNVETVAEGWRDVRLDLEPATGALYGLTYPIAPDLDGIFSPLQALLYDNLARFGWPARIRWLRLLGADWLVRQDDGTPPPQLEKVAEEERLRVRGELYRIPEPAPIGFWPQEVAVAASPIEALGLATRFADPTTQAVASRAVTHRSHGRVTLLSAEDDRLRFEVESDGGLMVVQRAYFPLIEARLADGRLLPTQPVDLVLLGVEVPAGRHEVRIGTSQRPEAIASCLSLATIVVAIWVGRRRL